jgi:hypothetical protein
MPTFTLELTLRGDSGQKSYWESVVKELQEKGARILKIQSKAGKVGEPLTTVNVVTITYEAPAPIKYDQVQS